MLSAPFLDDFGSSPVVALRLGVVAWVPLLTVLAAILVSTPTLHQMWEGYVSLLSAYPLSTKAVTAGMFQSLSDAVTQGLTSFAKSEYKGYDHNWRRTRQALVTGFLWSGPVGHVWFPMLERIVASLFTNQSVDSPVLRLLSKIVLDALLFSPFTILGYLLVSTFLSPASSSGWKHQASTKLRTRFWLLLKAAWRFWPVVNAMSFWYIPVCFRVLYSNVWSLVWSGYLSYVNNLPHTSSPSPRVEKAKQ